MALALDLMRIPEEKTLAELLSWRPRHGVISLYVDSDPADRSDRWRIEIRNGLEAAAHTAARTGDREARLAVEATVKRIEADSLPEFGAAEWRGLIGFIEAAREAGEERWYGAQLAPRGSQATYGRVALVAPLVALLAEGSPLGIAALSSERVRLLDWRLGQAREIHAWDLEVFSGDWRERKARRSRSPAGPAVSSAGRDQYNQRLEANRERFANETGKLVAAEAARRGWRQLLAFGDERYVRHFADGLARRVELRHVDSSDLISDPTQRIEERVERLLPDLIRDRDLALIEQTKEVALAGGRTALGPQETLQALAAGRVEHLLFDAERDYGPIAAEPAAADSLEMPLVERMIELAVSSGAAITAVSPGSAAALNDQEGVAAVLRY